ncbi:MAG: tRNA pseudouridine(38-40) synthase TruA [Clostridia bacterium]|nr:tRNA pseudouridine(38-40) synthase TruA [Clostridia bacterium]
MRNLMVRIKYDGSGFCGWQVQNDMRTVQLVFQNALRGILKENVAVKGCSRTDSGVHANEFCVSFRTECMIPCERLPLALNAVLPHDIAAFGCEEVPEGFHARYSCMGKQYRYLILNTAVRDPFWHDRALWYKYPLDEEFMNAQAGDYLGTHDFSAFCASNSDVEDKVRTVSQCGVRRLPENDNMLEFTVTADGFLYNMVRIMVGTLLQISAGRLAENSIPSIISSRNRDNAGFTAAACGLYLNKVLY